MFNFRSLHFKEQREDENVIAVIHRHWFNLLRHFFMIFLMVLLLIGSYGTLPALFPIINSKAYSTLFTFLESLFAMLVWILLFLTWIDYYFDVWIITSKRVVNIEQKGLFSREISELNFDKIQDITTEVTGMLPTFLNYGDVQIQTAAEQEKFLFRKVPDPYQIKDLLMNLQKGLRHDEAQEIRDIVHGEDV